jgi:hypothetical protein
MLLVYVIRMNSETGAKERINEMKLKGRYAFR